MATEVEIVLEKLVCHEPEDVFGDEGFLLILNDDAPRLSMRRNDLDSGEHWSLNITLRSRSQTSVLLFDLDDDRHDFLGWSSLSRVPGAHTAPMRRQGARYTLHYRVRTVVRTIPTRPETLRIDLLDVTCAWTEDVTGTDDFFVSGALLIGEAVHPVLTRPTNINDTHTNPFRAEDRILYSGPMPSGGGVHLGLIGMEDDASTDWANNAERIREVAHSIRRAVEAVRDDEDSDGTTSEAIVDAALDTAGLFVSLDRPDVLGRLGLDVESGEIEASPHGHVHHWRLELDGASYVVRLRLTGSRVVVPGPAV